MIREIAFGSDVYEQMLRFREAHLRRPIGLRLSAADRDGEERQIHVAAIENDIIVGTVVLQSLTADRVKLRQMAVAPERRGQGLGRDLARFAEGLARGGAISSVEVSARVAARGFYEALGYRAPGLEFDVLGVPHIKMTKHIAEP